MSRPAAAPPAHPSRRWVLAGLAGTALAGCAARPRLVPAGPAAEMSRVRSVYVGTTRRYEGGLGFGAGRSAGIAFARYDVSVPPERQPGEFDWPVGREAPDPARHFLLAGGEIFDGARPFRADLARALAARPRSDREAVIYVHGFNNTFDEAVLRLVQLAEDFELPAVAVHFSWPSAGTPVGYAYDRDSVLYSRDGLLRLIAEVERAGVRRIVLVGHSLGSMLVMEALRQMAVEAPGSVARRIGGVILISPDLDVDLFRAQARRIGRLPQPFGIFVSRRDRVLTLSASLTGRRDRLGNLRSFDRVADLDVTVIDITAFSADAAGHFTLGNSPALISLFSRADAFEAAFRGDSAGNAGLAMGTVLTVRNATAIIVNPLLAQ
ncbi:Esterase/lipase superfamily enzyme [Meinhardsimonia xiamenensis]|uniref:Esterase/lipase superfamily enzyme n=2 Tax=Meinhardsimonia xiamenensis TaxID=990712 RepID=A0A1G8Y4H0_9RHOB|nr:esterase/lipase superfamily enzyme [Meinhardsimonia xiamenensis]SDJ97623.1 Esterase/lipase superfamily enzyme [Meinhardsimonia xiamenensis]